MVSRAICIAVGGFFVFGSFAMEGFSWKRGHKDTKFRPPTIWNRLLIFAIGLGVLWLGILGHS